MLLVHQGRLGLSDGALVVLLNLLMAWWHADESPFVRPETIAKRMGSSPRTVQRLMQELVRLGLVRRVNATRRQPVSYDLRSTVEKLSALAAVNPPKPSSGSAIAVTTQTNAPM